MTRILVLCSDPGYFARIERQIQALMPEIELVMVPPTPDQITGKRAEKILIDDFSALEIRAVKFIEDVYIPEATEPDKIWRNNHQYGKRFRRSLRGGHR